MRTSGTHAAAGTRTRVVVFAAGGPLAVEALQAVAARHELALVVRPDASEAPWRSFARRAARAIGARPRDQLADWLRAHDVPALSITRAPGTAALHRLRGARADVAAIATFPFRIDAAVRTAAAPHVLNVHPALLPRHRGAGALFWTYHAGDADTGATVHLATDTLDAGAVVSQAAFPLERGAPVRGVHARIAQLAGPLLAEAIAEMAAGRARPVEQDAALVTRAPAVRDANVRSRLAAWNAAHAWHFLAGLVEMYRDPFVDARGAPVGYGRVRGYEVRDPRAAPGTVERDGAGWRAWTIDGVVQLEAGPDLVRVR